MRPRARAWPPRSGRCRSSAASIPRRSAVSRMAAKFSRPSSSRRSISCGQRDSPFSSPCVSDASRNPPFRPLAPQPQRSASSRATSSPRSAANSAAHRPVKPPPTTAISQRRSLSSGGNGWGASGESSQKTRGSDSAKAATNRGPRPHGYRAGTPDRRRARCRRRGRSESIASQGSSRRPRRSGAAARRPAEARRRSAPRTAARGVRPSRPGSRCPVSTVPGRGRRDPRTARDGHGSHRSPACNPARPGWSSSPAAAPAAGVPCAGSRRGLSARAFRRA